jgi:hypothetical protein
MTKIFMNSMCISAAALMLATPWACAQTPAAQSAPGAGGGPGRGLRGAAAYDYANNEGFTSLFDGATLNGWDGEPGFWSVKDSAIYVAPSCEKPTGTIYLVWQGGEVSDFILKYELKGTPTINSGVQFRSYLTADPSATKYPVRVRPAGAGGAGARPAGGPGGGAARPAGPGPGGVAGRGPRPPACANPGTAPTAAEKAKWDMNGPQADFDGNNNFSAMFYEQGGRGIIATPGHVIYSEAGKPVASLATLADKATLDSWFKKEDYNEFMIVAKGNTASIFMNGHLITEFIDTDPAYYRAGGKISIEVESTGELWARNFWLKKL